MQQIIFFFQKFKYFLLFLLLQIIALSLTVNNLTFQNVKFLNSTSFVSGTLYEKTNSIKEYLSLKSENKRLAEENTRLKNLVLSKDTDILNKEYYVLDTTKYFQQYVYTSAKIIKNEYAKSFNFLLVNKGKKDSIYKEMAVVNSKGVIGVVETSSANYSRVKSILSFNSRINARLKNTNFFGSLTWNGKNYNVVQLEDIPRQAPLKLGDTIETDGKSAIFPEGILIGKIHKIHKKNSTNFFIDVQLFNDMSNLGYVNIIKNLHKEELQYLEK